jgi:NADPH2:quinone reductase
MEGAGEVLAVGPGVDDVVPGERVAWCLSWGSFAEFALVPRARLAHVPDDIGLDVAAASLFAGCTAHYLVRDVAHVAAGMTCLVHAASGTIGQLLIQMSGERGARVLATTSTELKAAIARAKGAGEAFVYDDGGFVEDVLAATGGRGVDVSFDALGAPTLRDSLRSTRPRGLVVNYGSVGGAVHDLDPLELGEAGSLFLTRPRLADYIATRDELQRRSEDLFEGIRRGAWGVDIADVVTLDEAGNALSELEGRRRIGKALVKIAG